MRSWRQTSCVGGGSLRISRLLRGKRGRRYGARSVVETILFPACRASCAQAFRCLFDDYIARARSCSALDTRAERLRQALDCYPAARPGDRPGRAPGPSCFGIVPDARIVRCADRIGPRSRLEGSRSLTCWKTTPRGSTRLLLLTAVLFAGSCRSTPSRP